MEWQPFKINELIDLMNNDTVCFVYNESNGQYINFKIDGIMIDKGDSINKCYIYTDLDRDDVVEEPIDSELVGVCKSHAYYLWDIKQNNSNKISIGPRTKEEIEKCIKDKTIVYSFVKTLSTILIIKGIINQIDPLIKSHDFLLIEEAMDVPSQRWSLPIDSIFYTNKLVLSEIERIWK